MTSLLYRPQDLPKWLVMSERRMGGGRVNYNFRNRIKWYPVGWGVNKRVIGNQSGRLHYLACHAPEPVQKQWRKAYNNFYKKHFPVKASDRYANKYSCHSWL